MASLYYFTVSVHHWLSNLLFIIVAITFMYVLILRIKQRPFDNISNKLSLSSIILADVMLVFGLYLYFTSPYAYWSLANQSFGEVMKVKIQRYYSVEHITGMLIFIAFLHIGRIRLKKLKTDQRKIKNILIWFGLALFILSIMYPWGFRGLSGSQGLF